jgi:hypothetical protein
MPYFPLDRSTYLQVFIVFGLFSAFLYLITLLIYLLTKSKKSLAISFVVINLIILTVGVTILLSRTKLILTPFEISALKVVAKEKKQVLFVKQDTTVIPIYKAIKPSIYDDYSFAEKLTNTTWQTVVRPNNHVLKISDYKNKLIFVPKYLGADLSSYEQNKLKLKKIFDNLQISIFESI